MQMSWSNFVVPNFYCRSRPQFSIFGIFHFDGTQQTRSSSADFSELSANRSTCQNGMAWPTILPWSTGFRSSLQRSCALSSPATATFWRQVNIVVFIYFKHSDGRINVTLLKPNLKMSYPAISLKDWYTDENDSEKNLGNCFSVKACKIFMLAQVEQLC